MPDLQQSNHSSRLPVYQIMVEGWLDADWSPWFDDLTIVHDNSNVGPITTLTGPIPDQAGLRGVLCRLWDLGLAVISVIRLTTADSRNLVSPPGW
jgi:hypothetical protein